MVRPKLKYLIYVPLACACLTFLWLVFSYIKDCSTSGTSLNKTLEQEINKKSDIINKYLQSLRERENHQNKLLSQIENLKLIIEQQTDTFRMKRILPNTGNQYNHDPNLPSIFGITPTYTRLTQKADLTRLCQTFLHLPNFHWIVVEDSESKTSLVEKFLAKCGVKYTHLAIKTTATLVRGEKEPRWLKARGAEQRNAGLKWLRGNIDKKDANGVVYFMDDDNTYDLELFKQMRNTKKVSIWPVGLVGGLKWEGPVCQNGKVVKFHAAWDRSRVFPIDMAGFAVNLKLLLENPSAEIDIKAPRGHLESSLLKLLVKFDELEPVADNCKKILVWHTQTAEPKMKQEIRLRSLGKQSDPSLEV